MLITSELQLLVKSLHFNGESLFSQYIQKKKSIYLSSRILCHNHDISVWSSPLPVSLSLRKYDGSVSTQVAPADWIELISLHKQIDKVQNGAYFFARHPAFGDSRRKLNFTSKQTLASEHVPQHAVTPWLLHTIRNISISIPKRY